MKSNPEFPTANPGSYRPSSYWEDADPLAAILRNVKSTRRRQMITDYWNAGRIEELLPQNLADEPGPGGQQFLETIDPSFMGGAYLPDLLSAEVEIARIELKSTTYDVISIRAHREPGSDLIHYQIMDEYDTSFEFEPTSSAEPLTQDELVALIDGASDGGLDLGLALCYNEMNFDGEGDAESLRYFTSVHSLFYPQLHSHYESVFDRWVEEKKGTRGAEGEQEEDE
jgi:hypothetical protein